MSGGGSASPDYSASRTYASLLQQQQDNYKALYQPVENRMIAYATNPNTIPMAQQQAQSNVQRAFPAMQQGFQHSLQGQAVTLNPMQQQAVQTRFGLQNSLAQVDAMNRAGQQTYDTVTGVLTGAQPQMAGVGQGITTTGGQ